MSSIIGTLWEGLGLRRARAAADPDSPPRSVALPLSWDEDAAAALAALAPGAGPVSLPGLAELWIRRLCLRGRRLGLLTTAKEEDALAEALRALLLTRRGAPGAETWAGRETREPRFVLALPAFLDEEGSFDAQAYAHAAATAVQALDILSGGKAPRLRLGFADLPGLLAAFHIRYDSPEARDVGAAIAALTRGAGEVESGRLAALHGALEPVALIAPSPPAETLIPGLADAARQALDAAAACRGLRHAGVVALAAPDAVEGLLGAETGGLAPAAGHSRLVHDAGGHVVERPTRAALRAGARAAIILAPAPPEAREAMAQAIGPFLDAPPPSAPALPAAPRSALPRPHAASRNEPSIAETWRVTITGQRIGLHVIEDDRGGPREIFVSMPREGAAFRTAVEGIAHAVSIGLAHGVPLAQFVDAYAYGRIGPGGTVLGDGAIRHASSILDWVFRRMAIDYLGRTDLTDPTDAGDEAAPAPRRVGELPLLPLELPAQPSPRRRRAMRAAA